MPEQAPKGAVPPRLPVGASGRFWGWLGVGVIGLGLLLLFLFNPADHGFYPACQFHALTGWDCPGCGGLRATHFLLRGEFREAFRLNPLWVVGAPVLLGWMAYAIWSRAKGREVRFSEKAAYTSAAVILLFGVLRNLNW
jgi:hypothetical protein